jgi:ATP-dependent Lon protease
MALDPVSQPLKLAKNLPVAPLRGTVIFPGNNVPIVSGRPKSRAALDAAWAGNRLIVFVAQKNERIDDPSSDDLFQVGTVCLIKRIVKIENEYQLNAEGLVRVYIKNFKQTDPFFEAEIEEIPELYEKNEETEALVRTVKDQLRRYLELSGNPMFDINQLSNWPLLNATDDPNQLVNTICQIIEFKTLDKQQILEMVSSIDRLQRVSELMAKEIRILEISQKISTHTQERVSRMTKEAILREQMRSIEEELGENGENSDVREIELKIRKANMPKEVREKANKELNKLAKMSSFNPEAGYIRNYLEWLTDLPWKAAEKNKIDMKKAQAVLDSEHYGLKKVKERLFKKIYVRTSSTDSLGHHIHVGGFDVGGMGISSWHSEHPLGNVGLSAARKK